MWEERIKKRRGKNTPAVVIDLYEWDQPRLAVHQYGKRDSVSQAIKTKVHADLSNKWGIDNIHVWDKRFFDDTLGFFAHDLGANAFTIEIPEESLGDQKLNNDEKVDLGISALKSIIENIAAEQKIAIRKYGSNLNPLTLVYMMMAVIMPAMGITFMIVLSTFANLPISEILFWAILFFLGVFQFMFLGIIKSKRPNLI